MPILHKLLPLLSLLLLLCGLPACQKDVTTPADPPQMDPGSFLAVLSLGGILPPPETEEIVTPGATTSETRDGEQWECVSETRSVKKGAGGNGGFPLFSPNASVIYPGSLLQGRTLGQATPDVIAVERAGGSFSTDVIDGSIASSFTVNKVTKSEVTDALNNIVQASSGVVPANFSFSYDNVQSREEFALKLGVDVETAFTEVESKLQFSTDNDYNRTVVQLTQSFYTMSYDIPTSVDRIFAPEVTPEDLARYVGEGNPATYISDVTYGRVYYMLIESTSSTTELQAAVAGSFNGVAVKVDAEVEVDYLSELDNLKIRLFAYGGSSGTTLQTIGKSNINDLSALLAESADIRAGKAISYVVRSVYNNQIVSTQLATQYDVKNCRPLSLAQFPYSAHWTGQVVNAMGPVGAGFATNGTEFILINKAGDQWMRSRPGVLEGPFPIDALANGTCTLQGGVGAACNINGNEGDGVYVMVWDKLGINYTWINGDVGEGNWGTDVRPLADWYSATTSYPYQSTGVGALAFLRQFAAGGSGRFVFDGVGDKYCLFKSSHSFDGGSTFGPEFLSPTNYTHWGGSGLSRPFTAVGGAIGFSLDGKEFFIHFDKAGTKYCYYGDLDGTGSGKFSAAFDL